MEATLKDFYRPGTMCSLFPLSPSPLHPSLLPTLQIPSCGKKLQLGTRSLFPSVGVDRDHVRQFCPSSAAKFLSFVCLFAHGSVICSLCLSPSRKCALEVIKGGAIQATECRHAGCRLSHFPSIQVWFKRCQPLMGRPT